MYIVLESQIRMLIFEFRIVFKCSNYIQMFEFILYMAFQELEWHAVDDVDFHDAEADILEIVHESETPVLNGIEPVWTATDNNDILCFLNIYIFLCCWYLVEKKTTRKRKEISLLLLLSFLNPEISFFIWKEGEGLFVLTERDVTQEGSREQTRQSVMVGGRWVRKGNFGVT